MLLTRGEPIPRDVCAGLKARSLLIARRTDEVTRTCRSAALNHWRHSGVPSDRADRDALSERTFGLKFKDAADPLNRPFR